ncbi:peptide chain release factor 1, mitochondrial isoform X2 [Synchiropus splendidus]|uniref:peptide chain release factor 1, mitochondrial isoform X2 n=1 Tax=Synchiropus splendidus TaxID=270530 RepID=UPI00237E838E|nr:peptide chain release factor 1, mitochondrial isoform X2 [Synchiropus splendidus]
MILCRSLRLNFVSTGLVCCCAKRTWVKHSSSNHVNASAVHDWTTTSRRWCHGILLDLYRDESVQKYVGQLVEEHRYLNNKLQRAHLSNSDRKAMVRRHSELQPLAKIWTSIEQSVKELEEVRSLRPSSSTSEDKQFADLLEQEEENILKKMMASRQDLMRALVPVDPWDSSDVVLEVVSGRTTGGGLHHALVRIAGENVYRHLKHEGGTHRVQRIPEVGLSSRMQRIHTGTMTVIVLPQPTEVNVNIDPKDLRIDTYRSRGAGGQSVNTTDSAVRIVHLPTGVSVECQQTRSQLQNRDTAMRMLRARLYQSMTGDKTEQRLSARKQQVGTRCQSERIRTYNFSQDRVIDHRTGYMARDIKEFMKGGEELDDLITDLLDRAEQEAILDLVETNSRRQTK